MTVHPAPERSYRIGENRIEIWPDCVRTTIAGGGVVLAAPTGTDTIHQCADHEIAHSWASWVMGMRYVMWKVAHPQQGGYITDDQVAHEEHLVRAFLTGLGNQPRPWETT